jgi:hypothetical protein
MKAGALWKFAAKSGTCRHLERLQTTLSSQWRRLAWEPTIDERLTVERMKYCGGSEDVIARSLKIDVRTMRTHCVVELSIGHAQRRRQVIELLFQLAENRNVPAIRTLHKLSHNPFRQS